ncbi:MAG: acyl carrier protein [Bryobacteraceae bacterium]
MEQEQVTRRLTAVFHYVFDNPALVLERSTTAADVEDWDSLTHTNLIVAIEKEFKIRFTTGEVRKMNNVGDLIDLIAKKA